MAHLVVKISFSNNRFCYVTQSKVPQHNIYLTEVCCGLSQTNRLATVKRDQIHTKQCETCL